MTTQSSPKTNTPRAQLQVLANFRWELRRFLLFSESAAARHGLQPQQHQLLLQIAGAPDGVLPTISYAAERLGLRHNSAVELADRCERADLLVRKLSALDRRSVALELTLKGRELLRTLTADHTKELKELVPSLVRSLEAIRNPQRRRSQRRAGGSDEV